MATKKTNKSYSPKKILKDIGVDNMLENSGKPIGIMIGVLAGTPLSMLIDSQMKGKRILGMEGDKIKEWVKPCAKFVIGMGTYKAATNSDLGKYVGIGLAANGFLTALENIAGGRDFLQGGTDINIDEDDEYISYPEVLESATPLDLPVLDTEPSNYETSEIVEKILDENPGEREIEGLENVEGVGDIDLGRNEEQIAGETETIEEDSELDIDDIP